MKRPNIRRMFIPDKDYIWVEFDLSGADAQVVAWEAQDKLLMQLFRDGMKVHLYNAEHMLGKKIDKLDPLYPKVKKAIHLTNYGGKAPILMETLGGTLATCQQFQDKWFAIHPAIRFWHEAVASQLMKNQTLTTKWGRKHTWRGRVYGLHGGIHPQMMNAALAYVPQSTVADTINKGLLQVWSHFDPQDVQLLGQVHDSLLMQIKIKDHEKTINEVNELMRIPIPYNEPLIIPLEAKVSLRSWGDVRVFEFGGAYV